MRVVGDVECYPNIFTCTFVNYNSEEKYVFEISERVSNIVEFVKFCNNITYFIGFNSKHYDEPMIMYCVKNINILKNESWEVITKKLKTLNDTIINDDENASNRYLYQKYKYPPWQSIDLFMYWSKLARVARKLSLKSFQIALNWHRVQELPIHHNSLVRLDQIDFLLDYNLNDVLSTKALAKEMSKEINLRLDAKRRYGFNCLSWDGVKLGLNTLVKRYADRVEKPVEEIASLRTFRDSICINDILLPVIQFKDGDTSYIQFIEEGSLITRFKTFKGLYEYLKNLTVTDTSSINCQVMMDDGNRYDIKSGGLHTYHNPGVVICPDTHYYRDKDVSSYYPSFGEAWLIGPEHLGVEICEELGSIKQERLDLKHKGLGKTSAAELLKLSLNGGFYGNTNNKHTPMYDPQAMLKITINGQLALLMLCEKLIDIGVVIDMCNTDGITIMYLKELHEEVERICDWWQDLIKMELETVTYTKVVRMNINNYLAFYEEKGVVKVKEKGMFLTDPGIDMSRDMLIVPKALKEFFKNGTPVEETIRNHKDIYDFCLSQKCDKSYTVWHNGKQTQRLNRYYITKSGAYLYKCKEGGKMQNMLKGHPVVLFNDYFEVPFEDYNVDYNFYIAEAKKIINELLPMQKSLF